MAEAVQKCYFLIVETKLFAAMVSHNAVIEATNQEMGFIGTEARNVENVEYGLSDMQTIDKERA